MILLELEGEYSIVGRNQNADGNRYKGSLKLTLDEHNRVNAKWLIHGEQEQTGYGFFKDNILVINFRYQGNDAQIYKGVAVYKCLTKDLLEGFWSEKHGDLDYLGEENCFRVDTTALD